MRRLHYLTIAGAAAVGLALAAPQPSHAAFLFICDHQECGSPDPFITFNVNDFEGGFQVNGQTIQSGLGNPVSVPFDEGAAPTIIDGAGVFNFSGAWRDRGATTPTNQTLFFINPFDPAEDGTTAVSDVLHFTYSTDGTFGHLDGFVMSDVFGGISIAILNAAGIFATETVIEPDHPFDFSNAFITARFQSEAPEPASLTLLGTGLVGLAFAWHRKARKQG